MSLSIDEKSQLPLIEKYRPKTLSEIIDHEEKISTLRELIASGQLPHLLFYGPPGSGKTSMILALGHELYGKDFRRYSIEINGSSERGIDIVRGNIVNFIQNRSDRVKLVILDEADALTAEAQNALKSVMEKYAKYCRFCLICNDVTKIFPPLHSRCVKMVFTSLKPEAIKAKLLHITELEAIDIDEEGVDAMISLERDFRQILNILQGMSAYYRGKTIGADQVYAYMGKPTNENVDLMINSLFSKTFSEAYEVLLNLSRDGGINIVDMVHFILKRILTLSLAVSQKHFLIETLSRVDRNVRSGCNTDIQLALLAAAFLKARSDAKKPDA